MATAIATATASRSVFRFPITGRNLFSSHIFRRCFCSSRPAETIPRLELFQPDSGLMKPRLNSSLNCYGYFSEDADYPHSAIENLEYQLNLMDKRIGVKSTYNGFPRWSVGEDEQGLYINRDMIGLHEKDVKEYVPTRDMTRLLNLTHFDTPCPSWDVMKEAKELDQFIESTSGMPVISYLRAFFTMRYTRAIYIVAGHEGPDPGDPNGGYLVKIDLPGRFYKIKDVNMQIFWDIMRITIPKKNNQNPVYKIKGDFLFFRARKST